MTLAEDFRHPSVDYNLWVEAELAAKGLTNSASHRDQTRESLRAALGTSYAGVALDIDGTLTEDHQTTLTDGVCQMIRELLRRGVFVVLVTGRGKTSEAAIRQVLDAENFSRRYAARLYCLIDSGATLMYLTADDPPCLITDPLKEFASQKRIGEWLEATLRDSLFIQEPRLRMRQGRARITFSNEDDARQFADRLAIVPEYIHADTPMLLVARGTYGKQHTVDICPTSKGVSLALLCERLGIEPDKMARVADRGNKEGNDYDLLRHPAGFSVGEVSTDLGKCHVVVPPNGHGRECGVQATLTLLSLLTFSPRLTIQATPSNSVLEGLLRFEQEASALAASARDSVLGRFAESLARVFFKENGLVGRPELANTIYDKLSGGVKLRHWEVISAAADTPLGRLFGLSVYDFSDRRPNADWSMYTDTCVLLRGIHYYLRWLRPPDDSPSSDLLEQFIGVSQPFLRKALMGIAVQAEAEPSVTGLKLLLGVMDNVRNMLLQMAHVAYVTQTEDPAVIPADLNSILHTLVPAHTTFMVRLHLANELGWEQLHEDYLAILETVDRGLTEFAERLRRAEVTGVAEEMHLLRPRECDYFLENLSAVELGLRKHLEQRHARETQAVTVVGLVYGGIELPFIASALSAIFSWEIRPALLGISYYSNLGGFNPGDYPAAMDTFLNLWTDVPWSPSQTSLIVADDNVTTARSLQTARDLLTDAGGDVMGALAVRYPGVNRYVQMSKINAALPDPDVCLTFVRGMVSPAPYARLIDSRGTEDDERYLDATGVFDKSKERIKRYLQKNYSTTGSPE